MSRKLKAGGRHFFPVHTSTDIPITLSPSPYT